MTEGFYNKEANMVKWGAKRPSRRYSLIECLIFVFVVLLVIGYVVQHTT